MLVGVLFSNAQSKPTVFKSPDGKISFKLSVINKKLFYAVDYNQNPIIETSAMGLVLSSNVFGEDVTSVAIAKQQKVNEVYAYRGLHSMASNKYNNAKISFTGNTAFEKI